MLTNGIAILSHWFSQCCHPIQSTSMTKEKIINRSYVNIRNSIQTHEIQTQLCRGRPCTHLLRHISSEFPSGSEDLLWAAFTISFVPSSPLPPSFLPSLLPTHLPLCLFFFLPYCLPLISVRILWKKSVYGWFKMEYYRQRLWKESLLSMAE